MNLNTNYSWLGMSGASSSKMNFNYESIIQNALKREQKPIQGLKKRSSDLQSKLDSMASLKSIANSLLSSTQKLNFTSTGSGLTKLNGLDSSIATRGAFTAGTYKVQVQQLAQRHTVSSAEFGEKDSMLSKNGAIEINGTKIALKKEDTVADITKAINDADAGVKARMVESNGKFSIQVSAEKTGVRNAIKLVDADGLAGELGFVNSAAKNAVAQPTATVTATPTLTKNTKIADIFRGAAKVNNLTSAIDLEGLAASVELSYTLIGNNTSVQVGTSETYTGYSSAKEMMEAILKDQTSNDYEYTRISDGNYIFTAKASPTQVSVQSGGPSATTEPDDDDSPDFLNVISAAQDAIVDVNGQIMTDDDNGFSFGGAQAIFSKTGDFSFEAVADPFEVSGSLTTVSDFASSFNALVDMVNKNSKFDTATGKDGAFAGDQQVAGLVSSIRKSLEDGMGGDLAKMGISFASDGRMSVDQNKLKAALDGDNIALATAFGGADSSNAGKLEKVLQGATAGALTAMQETSQRELDSVKSDLAAAESRVAKKETMLRKKFKMLEDFQKQAEAQQSQMASMLSTVNSLGNDPATEDKNSLFGKSSESSTFSMWG